MTTTNTIEHFIAEQYFLSLPDSFITDSDASGYTEFDNEVEDAKYNGWSERFKSVYAHACAAFHAHTGKGEPTTAFSFNPKRVANLVDQYVDDAREEAEAEYRMGHASLSASERNR